MEFCLGFALQQSTASDRVCGVYTHTVQVIPFSGQAICLFIFLEHTITAIAKYGAADFWVECDIPEHSARGCGTANCVKTDVMLKS